MKNYNFILIDSKKFIDSLELHNNILELNRSQYSRNIKEWITTDYLFQNENNYRLPILEKDFSTCGSKSNGGRPTEHFLISIELSKLIAINSNSKVKKEFVQYLLSLENKVENLELFNVKQAAFAFKVINALKYIENQKEVCKLHQNKFISDNVDSKHIYEEFWKYRSKIIGWSKNQVDEALAKYLNTHAGHNHSNIFKNSMSEKLSIIDINEAIRVAVLDILYTKGDNELIASNFANLCKNLANEMNIEPLRKNETNLYQTKESIAPINEILKIN